MTQIDSIQTNRRPKFSKTPRFSKRFAAVLLLAMTTTACVEGENEGFGTLMGAALGAWIGSEIGGHGDGQAIFYRKEDGDFTMIKAESVCAAE